MAAETVASDSLRIRSAEVGDESAIYGLLAALGAPFAPESPELFTKAFQRVLAASDTHLVRVAVENERVVGYALVTLLPLLHSAKDAAQIQEVVVDSEYQGRGVGSFLVDSLERECHSRGATQLTVATLRNASFYERLDYRSTADYLKKRFDF